MPSRYNPDLHHRRSTRLRNSDYSQGGAYFITICTKDRGCLFWNVGAYCDTPSLAPPLPLNDLGRIVEEEWLRTPDIRPQIEPDTYVVMPNHVHGIVVINQDDKTATERREVPGVYQYAPTNDPIRSPSQTIGAVVRGFKSSVTARVNARRGTPGAPIWQRNCHEHVIRNDGDLTRIRDYIAANPAGWADDENNPANIRTTPS